MPPIPTLVGDLGRRLLDTTDFGDRTLVLGMVLGVVLVAILLLDEIGRLAHPVDDPSPTRVGSLVVPLTVAVAMLILQRLFVIVL